MHAVDSAAVLKVGKAANLSAKPPPTGGQPCGKTAPVRFPKKSSWIWRQSNRRCGQQVLLTNSDHALYSVDWRFNLNEEFSCLQTRSVSKRVDRWRGNDHQRLRRPCPMAVCIRHAQTRGVSCNAFMRVVACAATAVTSNCRASAGYDLSLHILQRFTGSAFLLNQSFGGRTSSSPDPCSRLTITDLTAAANVSRSISAASVVRAFTWTWSGSRTFWACAEGHSTTPNWLIVVTANVATSSPAPHKRGWSSPRVWKFSASTQFSSMDRPNQPIVLAHALMVSRQE